MRRVKRIPFYLAVFVMLAAIPFIAMAAATFAGDTYLPGKIDHIGQQLAAIGAWLFPRIFVAVVFVVSAAISLRLFVGCVESIEDVCDGATRCVYKNGPFGSNSTVVHRYYLRGRGYTSNVHIEAGPTEDTRTVWTHRMKPRWYWPISIPARKIVATKTVMEKKDAEALRIEKE